MAVVLGYVILMPLEEIVYQVSNLRDKCSCSFAIMLYVYRARRYESVISWEHFQNLEVIIIGLFDTIFKLR